MARWILLVLLALAWVSPAQAWTRAQVRDAKVDLTLGSGTSLDVSLELGVEVTGGWLERLEISGLEGLKDASQDGLTAWLTREDGTELTPEVRLKNGVVGIRLTRQDAPRRGVHRLGLKFTVASAAIIERGSVTRLEWTLPGWDAGLEQAQIRLVVPEGTRAVRDGDLAQQVTDEPFASGQRLVTFQRVHVPRETPWRVAVDLPVLPATDGNASQGVFRIGRDRSAFGWAATLVLALSLLARQGNRKRAQLAASEMVPWIAVGRFQLGYALVLWALAIWVCGFSVLWASGLLLVAACLTIERSAARPRGPTLGHFSPIGVDHFVLLRRAYARERWGIVPYFDAASALGVACTIGACAATGWHLRLGEALPDWALALSCAVAPVLSTAHVRLPRTLARRVRSLVRAAQQLRLHGVALNLVWFQANDRHEEPRLRVLPARPHHGLLRIDVLADTRPGSPALVLCAVVLADSTAQRALSAHWTGASEVHNQAGKRHAFCKAVVSLEQDIEQLLGALASHEQQAIGAWVREQSEAA